MRVLVALLALLAFFLGSGLAQDRPDRQPEPDVDKKDIPAVAKLLKKRQQALLGDLKKIARASKDIKELREQRESGKFVLNKEEIKLEKSAQMDFHIFMERIRNNTLEVLALYDRVLGKEAYVDPLRKIFGKSLYQTVAVNWDEQGIEDIVDELVDGYGVKMYIKGNVDGRRTMNLTGEMTLLSILLQIENVFNAKLTLKNGALWFVKVEIPESEKGAEEKD